jgi:hypothetical protein
MLRANGVAMVKENVVAARKNATFSNAFFFPINYEMNREAKIAPICCSYVILSNTLKGVGKHCSFSTPFTY